MKNKKRTHTFANKKIFSAAKSAVNHVLKLKDPEAEGLAVARHLTFSNALSKTITFDGDPEAADSLACFDWLCQLDREVSEEAEGSGAKLKNVEFTGVPVPHRTIIHWDDED